MKDVQKYMLLKKNRTNLRQWLIRVRNNVIENFELPETPDKEGAKIVKKFKTRDDVVKNAEEAFKAVAEKKRTRRDLMDSDSDTSVESEVEKTPTKSTDNASDYSPITTTSISDLGMSKLSTAESDQSPLIDVAKIVTKLFPDFAEGNKILSIRLNKYNKCLQYAFMDDEDTHAYADADSVILPDWLFQTQ